MSDIDDDKENQPLSQTIEQKRSAMLERLQKRHELKKSSTTSVTSSTSSQLAHEDFESRALKAWINSMLLPPDDLELGNRREVEDFLKKDLSRVKLQEMLTSAVSSTERLADRPKAKTKTDAVQQNEDFFKTFLRRSSQEILRKRAETLFHSSNMHADIMRLVVQNKLVVRSELKIFSNIGMQAFLCKLLLSFQPIWLRLALEIVCQKRIDFSRFGANNYLRVMSKFILSNVLADYKIVDNDRKLAYGQQKRLLTSDGVEMMHKNFLARFLVILYFIEQLVMSNLVPSVPCMFWPSSSYKSISDILSVLSREVLSGGSSLKCLQQIGFLVAYRQGFFEEYKYSVSNMKTELIDGVIFAKLVEIISAKRGVQLILLNRLRNPNGDRVRRIYNVRYVLDECVSRFPKQFKSDAFRVNEIIAGKYDALVEFVWALIAVVVDEDPVETRLEFLSNFTKTDLNTRPSSTSTSSTDSINLPFIIEMKRLDKAAVVIQKWWRKARAGTEDKDIELLTRFREKALKITENTMRARSLLPKNQSLNETNDDDSLAGQSGVEERPLTYEEFKRYIDEKRANARLVGIPMRHV